MILLEIINTGRAIGTTNHSYRYTVHINSQLIKTGTISGFDRSCGWQELLNLVIDACLSTCHDCGMNYDDFGLDPILSNREWKLICPKDQDILLCANCILRRASKLPNIKIASVSLVTKDSACNYIST